MRDPPLFSAIPRGIDHTDRVTLASPIDPHIPRDLLHRSSLTITVSRRASSALYWRSLGALATVERKIRRLLQAIKDGIAALSIKDELLNLEARKAELQSRLNAPEMPELLHPRMADVYPDKVGNLCLALESEESRTGAADAIRALVEAIVLEPDGDQLKITLKGDLAGMLNAARDSKRSPDTGDLLVPVQLVAGACNRRYLQLWSMAA